MPLSKKAKIEKDDNLKEIRKILGQIKNGETSARKFKPPVLVEPTSYLTIYTEMGQSSCYKRGYVIELDPRTHNATAARYFVSEGPDTYTEIDLTMREFCDLVDYYKINELDIWYMFHKKIG
jgi:hypothetical protein